MNVGSTFSGVGGLDLGLSRAGMQHLWFCEWDPWRREILGHWWPSADVYGDVRELGRGVVERGGRGDDALQSGLQRPDDVDLLVGGFPCQDLSTAGKRKGLAGERSGLFYEYARIADTLRPPYLLIENVPGLLTSHGGRDFGILLETMAELGYGMAWRVLDSRYFGVPQRRRRVFLCGVRSDGDIRRAADRAGEVLSVGTCCSRHHPKSGKKGKGAAYASADGSHGSDAAGPLGALTGGFRQDIDGNGAYVTYNVTPKSGQGADLQATKTDLSQTLTGVNGQAHDRITAIVEGDVRVRRLTPVECERLQGWPDNWTNPHGDASDTRRMSAIGDGVTAPVGEWLGRRILEVDQRHA